MNKFMRIILILFILLSFSPTLAGSVVAQSNQASSPDAGGYYIGILSDGAIVWFNCFGWQPNAALSCSNALKVNGGGGACKSCSFGDWIDKYILFGIPGRFY